MAPTLREIRASYDHDCITVYQAYNSTIAEAAVATQRLSASILFNRKRMTWIKPSWCWMMYRSDFSYKDDNQARILAIKMTHENFTRLLQTARLSGSDKAPGQTTVIQWDPERSFKIGRLEYRSIQIGIKGAVQDRWIAEWIRSIEDVTEKAREMKAMILQDPKVTLETLVSAGVMPREEIYPVDEVTARTLGMNELHIQS